MPHMQIMNYYYTTNFHSLFPRGRILKKKELKNLMIVKKNTKINLFVYIVQQCYASHHKPPPQKKKTETKQKLKT